VVCQTRHWVSANTYNKMPDENSLNHQESGEDSRRLGFGAVYYKQR